jgi:hypothetical protein
MRRTVLCGNKGALKLIVKEEGGGGGGLLLAGNGCCFEKILI